MTIPNFLKGPLSMSDPKTNDPRLAAANAAVLPTASGGPLTGQAYAPPRYRSQAYAQAQAEWDQLENELAYTKDQCESLRAQCKVAEETIKALKLERDDLRSHNERLLRENATIGTSVGRAVDVLIGLKQELERTKNGHHEQLDPSIENEAKLAIERAIRNPGQ